MPINWILGHKPQQAPLEVDQGDPQTGELGVLMMHDLYISFLQKKRKFSSYNLILFPMFSSLSLESPWIM